MSRLCSEHMTYKIKAHDRPCRLQEPSERALWRRDQAPKEEENGELADG